ncbi:MAG: PilW family protein, partial [Syntrophorhabdaceae bacterium]|nr:PilW family protein [Syntrophorhabdaceae bacterium]
WGNRKVWVPSNENLDNNDWVVVLTADSRRALSNPGAYIRYGGNSEFHRPDSSFATNIMYGIGADAPVRPFNRADYFVADASNGVNVPSRCAPGTGVLVKGIVNHNAAGNMTLLPILDCVADMKVMYGLDTNNDQTLDTYMSVLPVAMTAEQIRNQLVEVRISILAHEGQISAESTRGNYDFTYLDNTIRLGFDVPGGVTIVGNATRDVPVRPAWRHYRWKVYNFAARPISLSGGVTVATTP